MFIGLYIPTVIQHYNIRTLDRPKNTCLLFPFCHIRHKVHQKYCTKIPMKKNLAACYCWNDRFCPCKRLHDLILSHLRIRAAECRTKLQRNSQKSISSQSKTSVRGSPGKLGIISSSPIRSKTLELIAILISDIKVRLIGSDYKP